MAKTDNPADPADPVKLVEVRLLRNYVPEAAEQVEGSPGVYVKRLAGEVLSLPRDEAKRLLDLKVAEITADLI